MKILKVVQHESFRNPGWKGKSNCNMKTKQRLSIISWTWVGAVKVLKWTHIAIGWIWLTQLNVWGLTDGMTFLIMGTNPSATCESFWNWGSFSVKCLKFKN